MDALYQGASAALMLVGLAAMLGGIAMLWRAVGWVRAEQGQLSLDEAAHQQATQRAEAEAEANRQRMEMVQTLLPAATAALGHWLGSQSGRHDREDYPPPGIPCGCRSAQPPIGSPPYGDWIRSARDDEDTQVELDLDSLLDSVAESRIGDWLIDLIRQANASPLTTTAAPEPDMASASVA